MCCSSGRGSRSAASSTFVRSNLGFAAKGVLTLAVGPSNAPGDANAAFYAPLLERIAGLPDVVRSGAVSLRPLVFDAVGVDSRVLSDEYSSKNQEMWMSARCSGQSRNGVARLLRRDADRTRRRSILRRDRHLDQHTGNRHQRQRRAPPFSWPARRGTTGCLRGRIRSGRRDVPRADVVGVVRDVRYRGLTDVRFDFYLPFTQNDDGVKHLVVATRSNPMQVYAQIVSAVRALDPQAVIDDVNTMEEVVNRAIAPWRLNMVLFAVLGALGLAVASIGVYGVVRFAVVERWHELGVRAALGASQRQLMSTIAGEGARLVALGILTGAGIAWMVSRAMTSILFGIDATDAITFVAVTGGLAVVAGAAAYLPARAAGRADPSVFLRSL